VMMGRDRQSEPALRLMWQVGPEPARDVLGQGGHDDLSNWRSAHTFSMASSGSELPRSPSTGTPNPVTEGRAL